MPVTGLQYLGGALIKFELLFDKKQSAQILITQLGRTEPLGRISRLRKDDLALTPVFIPLQQNAGAAIAHLQHARQQQGGDFGKRLDHFPGRQPAPLGGTAKQVRCQQAGHQWQTGRQGILAVGHPIKAGQKDQALQQLVNTVSFCLHSILSLHDWAGSIATPIFKLHGRSLAQTIP